MSQGIYRITNLINGKSYIGKSSNIEERWSYHKTRMWDSREYNKPLYRAFRKYGLENFSFEIVEELPNYEQEADDKEKYYIGLYNTYGKTGYNATLGGDGGKTVSNYRSKYGKLTTEEVIYLRKRYIECKYPASYIYQTQFKDKISQRGFQAIWTGENAKNIMPEVFTPENKAKQIKLSRAYEGVQRRKITLEEKQNLQKRIENGEKMQDIWKNEYQNIYSKTGFRDMLNVISLDEVLKLDGTEPEPLSL